VRHTLSQPRLVSSPNTLLVLAFALSRLSGQETGLRLQDLEKLALSSNPTMAQAEANIRAAAGLSKQSGLYPNPTIGYYGDEIRGGYYGGGKQGGFFSQTIVTGGKLHAARKVAELRVTEADATGQIQRERILNNVRAMFYKVLANQRLVEVRQNLAKLATDAVQVSRQLANVGQADRPDVLQSEVEQQQAKISLRIAQGSLDAAWRMLAAVVGKPDLALVPLEGNLEAIPDLKYHEWVTSTLRESPEVKLARQSVERTEAAWAQARKAPIPDLELSANFSQNNETLETTHRPTGFNAGVQIGVQLPIFNRNQGNIAAAKSEWESAQHELQRVRLEITRDLAGMFRDYDAARVTAEQYKTEMLPRAQEAYRLYQANYQNMAAAYPQALISQRTLFQLEAEYVQALESAWQNALVIQGFGLMDGLSPVNAMVKPQ
jgi:outer membrane protein, heavy metal efflux system